MHDDDSATLKNLRRRAAGYKGDNCDVRDACEHIEYLEAKVRNQRRSIGQLMKESNQLLAELGRAAKWKENTDGFSAT